MKIRKNSSTFRKCLGKTPQKFTGRVQSKRRTPSHACLSAHSSLFAENTGMIIQCCNVQQVQAEKASDEHSIEIYGRISIHKAVYENVSAGANLLPLKK